MTTEFRIKLQEKIIQLLTLEDNNLTVAASVKLLNDTAELLVSKAKDVKLTDIKNIKEWDEW